MAQNQLDAVKQIRDDTITNAKINSAAAIALTKLAEAVIQADGGQAFTGDQSMGSHKITSLTDGTADTDAATVGQMNALINGFDIKASCRLATTGSETFTISGGAVTVIAGTTIDGQTTAVGNRILVKNAPASTGAGVADTNGVGSSQPANGVYTVTNATTNTTISRATDADVSAEVTAGLTVWATEGTAHADQQWTLTTNDAITLNTTALQFTNIPATTLSFSGGLTKTGNSVTRDALTGDVTTSGNAATIANNAVTFAKMADIATDSLVGRDTAATGDPEAISVSGGLEFTGSAGIQRSALTGDISASAGSNTTAIGANKVTLGMQATLAANSLIGNSTGSTATPTAVPMVSAATASTAAIRDANANVRFNNQIDNFQTVVSAAGTTTLAVGSPKVTQITGSTTQTVVMPDATTLVIGQAFTVTNRSSGVVTVNMNGGSLLQTMAAGSFLTATVVTIGTAAGTWDAAYTSAGGSGSVTTVSVVSTNGFNGSVANASTTPAITLTTTITGVLKGNGTAISAASSTAGADYVNAANFITRETPSGAVNGSNTSFVLANTPIVGTEQVYLNGLLQEAGAGTDYTISGATITYLTAPITGDKIRVTYLK